MFPLFISIKSDARNWVVGFVASLQMLVALWRWDTRHTSDSYFVGEHGSSARFFIQKSFVLMINNFGIRD